MEETNFDSYIKELALTIVKNNLSIRIVKDWPDIKVQLVFDGEVVSESSVEIFR